MNNGKSIRELIRQKQEGLTDNKLIKQALIAGEQSDVPTQFNFKSFIEKKLANNKK